MTFQTVLFWNQLITAWPTAEQSVNTLISMVTDSNHVGVGTLWKLTKLWTQNATASLKNTRSGTSSQWSSSCSIWPRPRSNSLVPVTTRTAAFMPRDNDRHAITWTLLPGGWPIRPLLGFWGSKVPQNGRFPAQDAHEPPCKIWRRLLYPRRRNP